MAALLFTNFDRINSIFTQRGQVSTNLKQCFTTKLKHFLQQIWNIFCNKFETIFTTNRKHIYNNFVNKINFRPSNAKEHARQRLCQTSVPQLFRWRHLSQLSAQTTSSTSSSSNNNNNFCQCPGPGGAERTSWVRRPCNINNNCNSRFKIWTTRRQITAASASWSPDFIPPAQRPSTITTIITTATTTTSTISSHRRRTTQASWSGSHPSSRRPTHSRRPPSPLTQASRTSTASIKPTARRATTSRPRQTRRSSATRNAGGRSTVTTTRTTRRRRARTSIRASASFRDQCFKTSFATPVTALVNYSYSWTQVILVLCWH